MRAVVRGRQYTGWKLAAEEDPDDPCKFLSTVFGNIDESKQTTTGMSSTSNTHHCCTGLDQLSSRPRVSLFEVC